MHSVIHSYSFTICNLYIDSYTVMRPDHIFSTLYKLHWLPIKQRIELQIAAVFFKILRNKQHSYLLALLRPYAPNRSIRSSNSITYCKFLSLIYCSLLVVDLSLSLPLPYEIPCLSFFALLTPCILSLHIFLHTFLLKVFSNRK